jgi:hypothetical protein
MCHSAGIGHKIVRIPAAAFQSKYVRKSRSDKYLSPHIPAHSIWAQMLQKGK